MTRVFTGACQFWGAECEKIGLSQFQEVAMKERKEEKRERLMAKAASIVDAYLEWDEKNPRPDLMQIEDIALRLRKEVGQEIAQIAIEDQESETQRLG
jgi:hypothetical protein